MSLSRRTMMASALALRLLADTAVKIVVAGGHPGDPECGCAGTYYGIVSSVTRWFWV